MLIMKNMIIITSLRDFSVSSRADGQWSLGCVIPASWPPLTAGASFKQPRDHAVFSRALYSRTSRPNGSITLRTARRVRQSGAGEESGRADDGWPDIGLRKRLIPPRHTHTCLHLRARHHRVAPAFSSARVNSDVPKFQVRPLW